MERKYCVICAKKMINIQERKGRSMQTDLTSEGDEGIQLRQPQQKYLARLMGV
jgi:hypothetical protein